MRRTIGALLLLAALVIPAVLRAAPPQNDQAKLKELEVLLKKLNETQATGPEFHFQAPKTVARTYNCADLTVRLTDFTHPNILLKQAGAEQSEESPTFGKEEEGQLFFANIDDLMDLVTANVRPEVWKGGASRIEVFGTDALLVIAEPDVQKAVSAYLDDLRASVGRTVTVELRVLNFPKGTPLPLSRLSRKAGLALLSETPAKGGPKIATSARLTGFSGQKISLFGGGEQAFVQDYDVEVAQDASISDPVVGVLQTGLSFDVRATAHGRSTVRLDLSGQFVVPDEPLRSLETSAGTVQVPRRRNVTFATTLTLKQGTFALIDAGDAPDGGHWTVLVSARSDEISIGGGK